MQINGVLDVHHIHVWSIDLENNYATLHVVTKEKNTKKVKNQIRKEMEEHGVSHTTIEIEDKCCGKKSCEVKKNTHPHQHHH